MSVMQTSKLCPHFQGMPELTTEATEIVRASAMPWVKGVDVHKWHCAPREMFPGKSVLARCYMIENAEASYIRGGIAGARLYFANWKGIYEQLLRGGAVAVEGPNEHYPDMAGLPGYLDFAREWIRLVAEMGLRPAWTMSTGRPALQFYGDARPTAGDFAPIWDALEAGNGIWCPHEYGAPDLMHCAPHLMLRYRLALTEVSRATGAAWTVPIIVSECGIDGGVRRIPAEVGWGWKRYMNMEQYQAQLAWYDEELGEDDQMLAATVYTTCPTQAWASFDVNGGLLRWMASRYNEPVIPPEPDAPIDLDALRRKRDAIRDAVGRAMGLLDNALDELDALDTLLG